MHNIATIEGQVAMAYLGATPWHQLGTPLTGKPDVTAALAAAHLDWNVTCEPLFLRDGTEVPTRRAVIRDVDRAILGTVGSDYEPFQNAEAFGVLDVACRKHGVVIETAGALGRGERVWALAKLPDRFEPISGDFIDGYFLIETGHDGATPYTARPTPVRVVCQNTLTLALAGSKAVVKLPHLREAREQLETVGELVTDLVTIFKRTNESFAKLAARKLDEDTIYDYIDEVLGLKGLVDGFTGVVARRRATIFSLVDSGKGAQVAPRSAWAAYNAFTEYIDHYRPAEAKTERGVRRAIESAAAGRNAALKVRALNTALELVA